MVEQVLNGSTLRVVLPDMRVTTLTVAGVQCPSLGRRVSPDSREETVQGPRGVAGAKG